MDPALERNPSDPAMVSGEPIRTCSSCGHRAYRFRPCRICDVLAAKRE
jgi:hypothetical protein